MSDREPDFWTCQEDAEHLDCSDMDEAIVEHLDGLLTPKMTAAEVLAAVSGPVEVYGYARDAGPDAQECESWAEMLAEQIEEWRDDEWGDPDGTSAETPDHILAAARDLVDAALKDFVWRCSKVCTRTVEINEAWIEANVPEWLDEGDAA